MFRFFKFLKFFTLLACVLLFPKYADAAVPTQSICAQNQALKQAILKKAPNLNPKVFALALKAYQKVVQSGKVKKPILSIVDYSRSSTEPRLWVIDLSKKQVQYTLHVSHGKGSGRGPYPKKFSNKSGSLASSLGVFLTGKPYVGHYGVSLRLKGLEKQFNSKAYARAIVMHGAKYANQNFAKRRGYLGHSHGCLAIDSEIAHRVINLIKEGSVIFSYYPNQAWLKASTYL